MSVDIESYRKRLIEDVSTIYKYCKTFSKKTLHVCKRAQV